MAVTLPPIGLGFHGDPETQALMTGAVAAGNLFTIAVLRGKARLLKHPELEGNTPPILDVLPRLGAVIFTVTSFYFLVLAWNDAARDANRRDVGNPQQGTSSQLRLLLLANLLATAAVLMRTKVVFSSPPLSTLSVEALET